MAYLAVFDKIFFMIIGLLTLEIYMYNAFSLKDKRKYIKSIKDRISSNFKVSVAEVDFQDSWQRSKIAIAIVGIDKNVLSRAINSIINFSEKNWPDLISNVSTEFINI